jgi:uncharacterized protein (DUF1778 family)
MREKGKKRKEEKILIRVNKEEKKLAEELSKREGKNTSEFFRGLLADHKEKNLLETHIQIIEQYSQLLEKFKKLLIKP